MFCLHDGVRGTLTTYVCLSQKTRVVDNHERRSRFIVDITFREEVSIVALL